MKSKNQNAFYKDETVQVTISKLDNSSPSENLVKLKELKHAVQVVMSNIRKGSFVCIYNWNKQITKYF